MQPTKKKITRLSNTQMGMYLRCPHQWYLRYVQGIKIPPAGAMMQGRVYHEAVADNLKQKIDSGKDVSYDEMADRFNHHWKKDVVVDEVNWEGAKPSDLRNEGLIILKCFAEEVSPKIKPKVVEESISKILIPGELEVMGIIDIIDNKDRIIDHKLSAREKSQTDADKDTQASLYLWLHPECKNFVFHQIIKKRPTKSTLIKEPNTPSIIPYKNFVVTKRSPQQLERYIQMVKDTNALMKTGVFPPRCDSFWCSEKWCGYWSICKARYSVR